MQGVDPTCHGIAHGGTQARSVVLGSPCGLPGEALAHAKVQLMTVGLHPIPIYVISGFYTSPLTHGHKSEGGFTPNQKVKAGWPKCLGGSSI